MTKAWGLSLQSCTAYKVCFLWRQNNTNENISACVWMVNEWPAAAHLQKNNNKSTFPLLKDALYEKKDESSQIKVKSKLWKQTGVMQIARTRGPDFLVWVRQHLFCKNVVFIQGPAARPSVGAAAQNTAVGWVLFENIIWSNWIKKKKIKMGNFSIIGRAEDFEHAQLQRGAVTYMNLHQRETMLPIMRRLKPSFCRTSRPSDSCGRRTRNWMKDWPRPTLWVHGLHQASHSTLSTWKKNLDSSWCLAPQGDERLIREAFGNRGAEIEAYRSMSGKARGCSSYLFIICWSFCLEADYFTI